MFERFFGGEKGITEPGMPEEKRVASPDRIDKRTGDMITEPEKTKQDQEHKANPDWFREQQ